MTDQLTNKNYNKFTIMTFNICAACHNGKRKTSSKNVIPTTTKVKSFFKYCDA